MNTRKKESQNRLSHEFKSPEGLLLWLGSFLFLGLLGVADSSPNEPSDTGPDQGPFSGLVTLIADDGTRCRSNHSTQPCACCRCSSGIRGAAAEKQPRRYRHQ
jgi:hypothetical protein